ncbi:hypothetical protein NGRA_0126 [Nosema granulosis]|uniref:Uncharacterized protein n=1 Tax=Nosema granulosis TaxID=83296 RepID=A0A9P6L0B3_9MICR|nr:hypothetical protein NGRA_0126 [Nosema granulosis]
MFDAEYFKTLVNETTDLISSKEDVPKEDRAELEARIDSNKMALKLLAEDIEDEETRNKIKDRINNMYQTFEEIEIKIHSRKSADNKHERIEEDILKYSHTLKDKALRLFDGLEFDKKVLGEVSDRMSKNLAGTSENIKKINEDLVSFSCFSLFILAIIIFLCMYIIIRFM